MRSEIAGVAPADPGEPSIKRAEQWTPLDEANPSNSVVLELAA
jgi:hypothetical protein